MHLKRKSKIILGIDPGTVIMGFSIIETNGSKIDMLEMDVVKLNGKKDMFVRLGIINETIQSLIDKYQPDAMAIEAPFFGKNVQSMLKLGRAQGVAIAVAMSNKVAVAEYSPKKVKQSITGNGNATKEQIWKMLNNIMHIKNTIKYFDASDALAVAVCHQFNDHAVLVPKATSKRKSTKKQSTSWSTFIQQHPERIVKK
jgi:crossover junction endodeoxyribonuclease RuvC